MASISWFAGLAQIANISESGLGFFGSDGFGASVPVGSYQGRTFVTNSTGTNQGIENWNVKWTHPNSGVIGQVGSGTPLTAIPNYQATLNIRFDHSTPVKTQNMKFNYYDRVSLSNSPSGVTCKAAEVIHPNTIQTNDGSGHVVWHQPHGSSYMSLVSSPGLSGLSPQGTSTTSLRHDSFVICSISPDSIGSKLFACALQLEYL